MIYGQTTQELNEGQSWQLVFLWFPVRLIDGRKAWLETVEAKDFYFEGEFFETKYRHAESVNKIIRK